MEACATAHHWARALISSGHEVRLIPPAYVKPYLRRQKNDAADAAAICEAVTRPSMRFVPVKSEEQQATLMLHTARDLLVSQRTALINAIRGHFAEFGMVVGQGARNVHLLITIILEEDNEGLSASARSALLPLATALLDLDTQISKLSKAILAAHRRSDVSVRLATIPGIGPIVASSLSASIPDASLFKCGREFAAYLGWFPDSTQRAASPGWAGSQRWAIGVCESYLLLGPMQPSTPSGLVKTLHRLAIGPGFF